MQNLVHLHKLGLLYLNLFLAFYLVPFIFGLLFNKNLILPCLILIKIIFPHSIFSTFTSLEDIHLYIYYSFLLEILICIYFRLNLVLQTSQD